MKEFMWGALTMACLTAALFFFRFYRDSGERLFATFATAFIVLALHWTILALLPIQDEHLPFVYAFRLIAFGLMAFGIVDKNRRTP